MSEANHGLGGLKYDPSRRARAPEWNVFIALVIIVVVLVFKPTGLFGKSLASRV